MSTPTREQFLDEVLKVVGDKFPLVKIARADQPFSMRINGHVASLENLYRMSVLRPDGTRRHVERWIVELLRAAEGTPDLDGTFEELRARIMPMVVPENSDPHHLSVMQPLVEGLAVAYGIDNDRTISHVTQKRLQKWKTTIDDLHEAALANLATRSRSIEGHAAQDDHGRMELILFQTMDGYDASRLLLRDLHDKLREHLGSPFAAGIPNRDILLCFRNDEATVARLQPQIARDFDQMPHQITNKILLVTADGIAVRQ
ncbi:MAG: DUF1444 family protein [Tepidisphaeraceae bacterium]|jgi:hypothetical protein